jgi:hypothetical protein
MPSVLDAVGFCNGAAFVRDEGVRQLVRISELGVAFLGVPRDPEHRHVEHLVAVEGVANAHTSFIHPAVSSFG